MFKFLGISCDSKSPSTDQLSQMYKGKCWQLHVVVGYSCENDFDRLRSCEDDCLIIFYSEKEKLSVSSVSQPNFQFICHFFNQELNWKSQRAISLEKSLVGSNVDWSPVWAGLIWAPILESHFRRPRRRSPHSLTHTLRIYLNPWLHKYISQFLFLEKCSTFKSDIFSQWWSMVQSIITQFTHLQYKV